MRRFSVDGVTHKLSASRDGTKFRVVVSRSVGGSDRYVLFVKRSDRQKVIDEVVTGITERYPSFDGSVLEGWLNEEWDN